MLVKAQQDHNAKHYDLMHLCADARKGKANEVEISLV